MCRLLIISIYLYYQCKSILFFVRRQEKRSGGANVRTEPNYHERET